MGTRTYQDHIELLDRGFREVSVRRPSGTGWARFFESQEDWCLEHCEGEFSIRGYLGEANTSWGYFQSERDALMFILRWS